jgi:2-oxoglutarate ferredoxin oxidoreductase subunit delta
MGDKIVHEERHSRGILQIDDEECKGCGLCIESCPPKVIRQSETLNPYGYRAAVYSGTGCTGCGICFMVCPEPGAITVLRMVPVREPAASDGTSAGGAAACASN